MKSRGISTTMLVAVFVVLIIVAGVGGFYASSLTSSKVSTVTSTVNVSGTQTLSGSTVTSTVTSTASISSEACATPLTLTQVNVGLTQLGGTFSDFYVADSLGFFTQQGLKVSATVTSGDPLIDGLLTGTFDFIFVGTTTIVPLYLEGENVISLMATLVGSSAGGIVVSQNLYQTGAVKNVSGLNGLRVGVIAGPSTGYYLSFLQEKYYNVNWTLVTYPDYTTMTNALHTGAISGAVALTYIDAEELVAGGPAVMLVNPLNLGPSFWVSALQSLGYPIANGAYPLGATILTSPSFLQQNPSTVQHYINALTEAQLWIATHNSSQVLSADYGFTPLKAVNASSLLPDIEYLQTALPPTANITLADWQSTIYYGIATNPTLTGNETKLLGTYNTLVNTTAWQDATWCYNSVSWG